MKKIEEQKEKDRILAFLKPNAAECLYLAIDLEVYGLAHPDVEFYYSEEAGEIHTVLMKYYDTIQLYSPGEDWDAEQYCSFILGFKPLAVCAKKSMIEELEPLLSDYESEYGIVIADNKYMEFKQFAMVEQATLADVREIAELIYSTEEFSKNNSVDVLEKQLADRLEMGMGRNFIIREDGRIVAHTAIYAECGNAAVESGLVVHENYKRKFYGMIIHEYIKKLLGQENKTLFGLRYVNGMQRSAKAENLDVRAECGKLVLKEK